MLEVQGQGQVHIQPPASVSAWPVCHCAVCFFASLRELKAGSSGEKHVS